MKKVLIIAYHFPPIGGSGMQRTVKFVKYLLSFGWEPVVLSVKKGTNYELIDVSLLDEIPKDVRVYRTQWLNTFGLLRIPDKKIGWLPFGFFKGLDVLKKERISVVYSTSPTVTAHLIGYLFKKLTKLPWVADFRDPWIGNPARSEEAKLINRIEVFLESRVVHNADRVIANTGLLNTDFIKRYPDIDKNKFVTITNGYDPEDFGKHEAFKDTGKNGKFIITHTGEFYEKIRNPENFLKAVGALLKEGRIGREDIMINFVGSGEYAETERYKSLLKEECLQNIVNDVPYLPHKDSIRYLLSSDALLLFAFSNGRLQVPAKTYEYIAAEKPILALSDDGATASLLSEIEDAMVVGPDSVSAIKDALYDLYVKFKNNSLGYIKTKSVKQRFSRKAHTERLANIFCELTGKEQKNKDLYTKFYNKLLFPLYEGLLRGRATRNYMGQLEESQWFSTERLKEIQWQRLQQLLRHAYENVPFYNKRFKDIGLSPQDIKSAEDLSKIPYLTKSDIRASRNELIAGNYPKEKIADGVTGGSTGMPLKFNLDGNNYRWRRAAVNRVYGWAGYADGEKTVFIWGAPVVKQPIFNKLKHDLDEALKRHKIFNTFHLKESMIASYIDEINAYKPEHIVAYTTPLYNFARFIKENKKRIASPISIIAAAEKVYPSQRKIIEEALGAPLFETYGCREVTSIAGECEHHKGMHINMETIYLEIIKEDRPADKGETGEIVITDLTNYAMPFIRYKNEDLGSFSEASCACGRGLEMLKEVQGRVLDTIKTIDGRLIPGEFFIYWFMSFEDIRQFQVVQDDLRHLHIKIIQEKSLSNNRLEELKRVICEIMGTEISITFEIVDEIPLTPSGKFRVVVSKIPVNFSSQPAEAYTV